MIDPAPRAHPASLPRRHGIHAACLLAAILATPPLMAQQGGNQGGNQNGGNGGQFPGGILINPGGVVDQSVVPAGGSAGLRKQLKSAAAQMLTTELNQSTEIRYVSLKRLEQELQNKLSAGKPLPPEMRFLAGLTRIDYVMVAEGGQDAVFAGPAEGFAPTGSGRVVGVESGRPVLCLDDLLVAFRSAAGENAVGCSIDPDPQRLATAQQWLRQNSSAAVPNVARARLERMVSLQGAWNITTFGVPEESRMCLAMIEADYLMKRLAIGIDHHGIKGMKNSLSMAAPGDNMLRRWWFAPDYTVMQRNEEGTIYRMGGPRFQLFAQEEVLDANGNRADADFSQPSSEKFAKSFNERREELVRRIPAFADLQNIFDVLTAVAILQYRQSEGVLHWAPDVFLDADILPVQSYASAKETAPVLNVRMSGTSLIIGAFTGGVTLQPQRLSREFTELESDELKQQLHVTETKAGHQNRWWWD